MNYDYSNTFVLIAQSIFIFIFIEFETTTKKHNYLNVYIRRTYYLEEPLTHTHVVASQAAMWQCKYVFSKGQPLSFEKKATTKGRRTRIITSKRAKAAEIAAGAAPPASPLTSWKLLLYFLRTLRATDYYNYL